MFASLLALAVIAQAEETWQVRCPLGHPINVRGRRDGDRFLASFPVAPGVPNVPKSINFGLDLAHMPKVPAIRGTDADLGRELSGKLLEQRPCPGPGPCPAPQPPRPPRLPDPVAPEPPPVNYALVAVAGVFVVLALILAAAFALILALGRPRP